eukprot:CAMPEP_0202443670 /NCGR_PEP_ID=MMETSP1360-20130828/2868_1 /ASSEMBLY_ACC=CAM_ASM_000848 /TAXON_ID=515479 /ORGANISM="Licmophora paradoxa, Strain CCMP2313" /LENGTH=169 /DNA_ID=CAMNT_0049059407 /DNA_START=30 /DNA_END=536 /DNA_ORIENTATION=-
MTLELDGGIIVALRPHSRTRNEAPLPVNCDILASHEPPYNVLDYTYSGQRAGSIPLRKSIDESPTKPCLMLSGHIHEGRGARWHTFYNRPPRPGSEHLMRSTYVVNAANANSGRARRLVNGPVVLELVDEDDSDKDKSKNEHQTADEGTGTASNMKNMKFYRPDSLQAL